MQRAELMGVSSMLSTLFSETSSPTSFQLDCLAIVITESYFPAPNTGFQVCTIMPALCGP